MIGSVLFELQFISLRMTGAEKGLPKSLNSARCRRLHYRRRNALGSDPAEL